MYLEVRSVVVDSRLDTPCTFKVVRVVVGFQGWFGVKVPYSGCPSDFGAFLAVFFVPCRENFLHTENFLVKIQSVDK